MKALDSSAPVPAPLSASLPRFAWLVLLWNLGVMIWGAFVRASGSGAGCGAHWPLCNGVVVPRDPRLETLIEFGHRLTSGLALVVVVALGIWILRTIAPVGAEGRSLRRLAWLAMLSIFGEAALGAGLVLLQYVGQNGSAARAAWMAAHLVSTFALLALLALLAERLSFPSGTSGLAPAPARADAARAVHRWEAVTIAGLLLTAMSGAIAALGDTLFPATSLLEGMAQDLSSTSHFLLQLRTAHPLVAIAAGLAAIQLAQRLRLGAQPGSRTSLWAARLLVLVAAQFAVGLATLAFLAPIPLQLLHLAVADLLWVATVLLLDGRRREARVG